MSSKAAYAATASAATDTDGADEASSPPGLRQLLSEAGAGLSYLWQDKVMRVITLAFCAVVLFNGTDLTGWTKTDGKAPAEWTAKDGLFSVAPGKGNIMTEAKFGDCKLHLEFNVPYMPDAKGQARGNSGVFLAGTYEVQVLDSYGLKIQSDDCGAVYKQITPRVNACNVSSARRA